MTAPDIVDFVLGFAERPTTLADQDDLFEKLGIDGDDAIEFIDSFASTYEVDMADYRWYFHHGEEGFGIGMFFSKPPYFRVQRIPITLTVLREAIQAKHWPIRYPPHEIPAVRWDLRVNGMIVFALLAYLAFSAISMLLRQFT